MSTTLTTATASNQATASVARPVFWKAGLVSGAVASVATTVVVVAARAADIPVDVDGEEIPLLGFAQLTMIGALLGILIARVLSRRARQPRRTFVVTTVSLTALSLIPDVIVDASAGSKLTLMLTHVVAAAVVIPALASRFD